MFKSAQEVYDEHMQDNALAELFVATRSKNMITDFDQKSDDFQTYIKLLVSTGTLAYLCQFPGVREYLKEQTKEIL
jgi:hypothetical protein